MASRKRGKQREGGEQKGIHCRGGASTSELLSSPGKRRACHNGRVRGVPAAAPDANCFENRDTRVIWTNDR